MRKYTVYIPSPFLSEWDAKSTIEQKERSGDWMLEVDPFPWGENAHFKNQATCAVGQWIKGWYQYYSVN